MVKYEPKGKGVLISFDAKWKERAASKIEDVNLRQDFHNILKSHLDQMFPDVYTKAFDYGANMASHSVYVELKSDISEDDVKNDVKRKFYSYMSNDPSARAISFYNFDIKDESLSKVEKIKPAVPAE